uniref:Uncharacterized protein n=1 Tax=Solanum lycopersicum TaxID=4081 RepID=A0A3Q7H1R4_SOLLC
MDMSDDLNSYEVKVPPTRTTMVNSPSSEHDGVVEINKHVRESNRLLSEEDGDDKNEIMAIEIERDEAFDVVPHFSWKKLWEFIDVLP